MNNRLFTLLCTTAIAAAWVAPEPAALAAPSISPLPRARSYADLLEPVPDAVDRLKADDAYRTLQPAPVVRVEDHHHHHHHHHDHFGVYFGFGSPDGYYPGAPYYHPEHCYWTWGTPYWDGYRWVYPRVRDCD